MVEGVEMGAVDNGAAAVSAPLVAPTLFAVLLGATAGVLALASSTGTSSAANLTAWPSSPVGKMPMEQ